MDDSIPPYPDEILPRGEEYRDFIYQENIASPSPELVVQRRASRSYLRGAPSPEDFGGNRTEMSVNLLGAYFKSEHVCFVPKGYGPYPSVEPFSGIYDYIPDAKAFCIPIKDVHNRTFPSPRKFPDRNSYQEFESAIKGNHDSDGEEHTEDEIKLLKCIDRSKEQFSSKKEYTVTYRLQVAHRPTTANYWHCQIEVFPETSKNKAKEDEREKELIIKKEKAEWQKEVMNRAIRTMANILSGVAACSLTPSSPPAVPPHYYMKTPTR